MIHLLNIFITFITGLVEGKIYKETMVFPSKYRGFPLKMAIFPWDSGIPTVDSLRQALLIRKDDAPAKAAGPKERGKGGRVLLRACQPSKKYIDNHHF